MFSSGFPFFMSIGCMDKNLFSCIPVDLTHYNPFCSFTLPFHGSYPKITRRGHMVIRSEVKDEEPSNSMNWSMNFTRPSLPVKKNH